MNEVSVLIGGKAGFGIDKASLVIASLISIPGFRLDIRRRSCSGSFSAPAVRKLLEEAP